MFDGLADDLIKGKLQLVNVDTSRQVVRFIGPVNNGKKRLTF